LTAHFDWSAKVQALCLLLVGFVVALNREHLSAATSRDGIGFAIAVIGIGSLGRSLRSIKWHRQTRILSLSHTLFALGELLAICGGVLAALDQPAMPYLAVPATLAIVVGAMLHHLASTRAVI